MTQLCEKKFSKAEKKNQISKSDKTPEDDDIYVKKKKVKKTLPK